MQIHSARASIFLAALMVWASVLPVMAQDLAPTRPPSGTETPGTRGPDQQPVEQTPRRPNLPQRPGAGAGANDAENIRVPDDVQLVRDVVYATAPDRDGRPVELMMDCAFLKQSDGRPMPVVIYIHGGGWLGGHRMTGLPMTLMFARGGYFACTISYRFSTQAPFPAQIHDVKAAVRFIRAHAEDLVIDPERIGVWGHSAGGHLSAMLGLTGSDGHELEGDIGVRGVSSAVQAVVDVSGPTDLVRIAPDGDGGRMISTLLGGPVREKADAARAASPVTHVHHRSPPFLIIHGGRDDLVPESQAILLRDALTKAGASCEYLLLPEAGHVIADRRAYLAVARFFDAHLGGSAVEAVSQGARRPEARPRPEPSVN